MTAVREIVATFWQDGNTDHNLKLVEHLRDCCEGGTDGFLLGMIAEDDELIGKKAAEILIWRNPWLKLSTTPVAPPPPLLQEDENFQLWHELENGVSAFIHKYGRERSRYIPFTHLPALHHVVCNQLAQKCFPEEAEYFGALVNLNQNFKRTELIFAPTYRCNINCPYCYAKGWHSKFEGEATLKNISTLLKWMSEQGLNTLSLAGGEPTIYARLDQLFEMAEKENFRINLASNMLFSGSVRKLLSSDIIDLITAHYDQSYLLDESRDLLFKENLSHLLKKRIPFRLRYTLTRDSEPDEWRSIFDIIDRFDIDVLHFAATFMNYDLSNTYAACPNGTKEEAVAQIIRFCDDALDRGISLHLCKPVPLCLFPEEKLHRYLLSGSINNGCVAFDANCSRNLTVNPNLTIFPCTALALEGPKITRFSTIEEAGAHFREYLTGLRKKMYMRECESCLFYYSGICQQVCLVEKNQERAD